MSVLDAILGRESLKERITELEDERDSLEAQLAAETERRSEAVRDRQTAQERVNQLEDRIAGLEGELARREDDETAFEWRRVEAVGLERTAELVDRLGSFGTAPEGAYSAAIDAEVPDTVSELLAAPASTLVDVAPCLVYADDLRMVRAVLVPPRPPDRFETWDEAFRIEPSWFLPRETGAFALVRSDLFAVGAIEDGHLADIEGFRSEVMGRHSKGGFSQARFERRRREQIDRHLEECRDHLAPYETEPLVLVGDRRTVKELADLAETTAVVDASGEPEEALAEAFRSFWRTQVFVP